MGQALPGELFCICTWTGLFMEAFQAYIPFMEFPVENVH